MHIVSKYIFFSFFDVFGSKSVRERGVGVVVGSGLVGVGAYLVKIDFFYSF